MSINFNKLLVGWLALFLSVMFCAVFYILINEISDAIILQLWPTRFSMLIFAVVGISAPIVSTAASVFVFRYLYAAINSFTDQPN